jgi:hypothetical protein
MLKAFAMLIILSLPEEADAQNFKKLGNGLTDSVGATCTDGTNFYVERSTSP